jgi:hypothetical protein
MTPEQRKEEIGKAYVHAVAARHGFKIGTWSVDDGCLDVTIGREGTLGGGTLANPELDLQLKSTSRKSVVRGDHVAWKLDRTHLRQAHGALRDAADPGGARAPRRRGRLDGALDRRSPAPPLRVLAEDDRDASDIQRLHDREVAARQRLLPRRSADDDDQHQQEGDTMKKRTP